MSKPTSTEDHEPAPPAAAEVRRLAFLDGVRGLAALYVAAHHLWRSYTDAALPGTLGRCTNWLLYGHLGVDVFIVLSGFCLMLPVARTRTLRGGWRGFYRARARRIIPPLYAVIILSIALQRLHSPTPTSVILANFLLLQDLWQSQNSLDAPLWSVALEWKIYWLFPGFVWLWFKSGPAALLLPAAALSAFFFGVFAHLPTVQSKTHCCSWYLLLFALGMAAAGFAQSPPSPRQPAVRWLLPTLLAGTLLCLAAMLWAWPITPEAGDTLFAPHLPLIDTTLGLLCALVFVSLGRRALRRQNSWAAPLLSGRPLVFLGSISYSLYLVHADLVYAVKNRLEAYLPFHPPWVVMPVDLAIVVGLAYLFHLACERPFMSQPAPRSVSQAAAATAVNPAP